MSTHTNGLFPDILSRLLEASIVYMLDAIDSY